MKLNMAFCLYTWWIGGFWIGVEFMCISCWINESVKSNDIRCDAWMMFVLHVCVPSACLFAGRILFHMRVKTQLHVET